jgi:hypothetical protein
MADAVFVAQVDGAGVAVINLTNAIVLAASKTVAGIEPIASIAIIARRS